MSLRPRPALPPPPTAAVEALTLRDAKGFLLTGRLPPQSVTKAELSKEIAELNERIRGMKLEYEGLKHYRDEYRDAARQWQKKFVALRNAVTMVDNMLDNSRPELAATAPTYERAAERWAEYKGFNPVLKQLLGDEAYSYKYPEEDLHNFWGI